LPELYIQYFVSITICGLVVVLGLETAGLGFGLASAGLDYKTVVANSRPYC